MLGQIRKRIGQILLKREMEELERWRTSHDNHRQRLAANYDAVKVLDNIKAEVSMLPAVPIDELSHELTKQRLCAMERDFKRGYDRRHAEVLGALV